MPVVGKKTGDLPSDSEGPAVTFADVPATAVMGVLNVTPDSFSDGGRFFDPQDAIARGRALVAEGATVVDVGGESTRPGAASVSVDDEIERVLPVIRALAPLARVSIDTRKADVAYAAVRAGASLINDVSASLSHVAARLGVGWVAMHMQGNPATMQDEPVYDDVVAEVSSFLFDRADAAKAAGVTEIFVDPGIGFGKTVEHNLALLRHLDVLTQSPYPVLLGTSRKRFLATLTAEDDVLPEPNDRLAASLATVAWGATQGVAMVRVHDVRETVRTLRVLGAIREEV